MQPFDDSARPHAHVAVTGDERAARAGHVGAVVWLTGLSGAGKSTLASRLERCLFDRGWSVCVLDGDELRAGLNADLRFSAEDRRENVRRISHVSALFAAGGTVCIVACISPFRKDRDDARRAAAPFRFIEVYIAADLATCEARDVKGLYRRARAGNLAQFTGIDSPYEPPSAPGLVLDTRIDDVRSSCLKLEALVLQRCSTAM